MIALVSCDVSSASDKKTYPDQFGEIAFDAALDDPGFQLCDSSQMVHSRVSLNYSGGRKRIEELCKQQVNVGGNAYAFNGYILIRFLVNCKGESDRFRIETLDEGFMPIECPDGLVSLVENAVRSLNEWVISKPENVGKDHSKYLNFKMVNGRVDAIIH
ncbi:hypothetical protein [Roseivirga sp. 4D4]|uniref:hypothetical protein n=1 Tax=Roseivirga sp. 4D4 TaxID=1889784 RepID=UPI001112E3B0|nr:hypothetical protein [Roseivirga sp. 4D4]